MKKFLIPALGVAAAFGAAQPAAAQFFLPGQPGVTGSENRTVTPGSPGISPFNRPAPPSPFSVAPSPSFTQPSPFIGQRGDLNVTEYERVSPAERDASGKLVPSVDRTRARFAGERGSDGKLLPTYGAQEAQASPPSQAAPPPTPAPSDMPATQPTTRRPGSGAMSTPSQSGTTTAQSTTTTQPRKSKSGSAQQSGSMGSSRGHNEEYTTSALNALSSQGYSNVGKMERVGNMYQTTAMKNGRQVSVQVDPETGRVTER